MTRLPRLVLAAFTLNAALLAGALAAPTLTFACMCAPPEHGGFFDGTEEIVLAGHVDARDATGLYDVTVTRWFRGGADPIVKLSSGERFLGGIASGSSCDAQVTIGTDLILAPSPGKDALELFACSTFADAASPEGRAMLAAAKDTFGPGFVPGQPAPQPRGPSIDLATVAIVAVIGLFAVVVVAVFIASIGREGQNQGKP